MFGKSLPVSAPYIDDVSYLDHYNLFVTFDNGDQRIYDASKSMQSPMAVLYRPIDEFKKFRFDYGGVYWGKDDDFGIMNDSIYDFSFPFSAVVSTSGQIVSISFAWVRNTTPFPIAKIKDLIRMYVHGREEDRHNLPHVHIDYKKTRTPFKLDGSPIVNLPPIIRGSIKRAIKSWILANLKEIADEWNKQNPDSPIDPKTGEYIKK